MSNENWKEIWERKGNLQTTNLLILDGSERHPLGLDKKIVSGIITRMDINPSDRILEVGCGAGMLARHFKMKGYNYQGVDYSNSLVKKHKEIIGGEPLVAEANNLPFEDGFFNKVYSWGVFLYFPSKEYTFQAILEMRRVCASPRTIYLGDLPIISHRESHLLFKREEFKGKFFSGFWLEGAKEERFDVLLNDEDGCYNPKYDGKK